MLLQPREPAQRLQRFAQPHVVGQNAAELQAREVTEKVETGLLIGAQLRFDGVWQRRGCDAFKLPNPLAQQLGLCVPELLQRGFVHLRRVQQGHFLRLRVESVEAQVSHRLVRGLNGGGVQLHPAAVRQFHKLASGGLQTLQVGGGELQSLLFPFRGHGEPVDAAAMNQELRTELARRKEQPLK